MNYDDVKELFDCGFSITDLSNINGGSHYETYFNETTCDYILITCDMLPPHAAIATVYSRDEYDGDMFPISFDAKTARAITNRLEKLNDQGV